MGGGKDKNKKPKDADDGSQYSYVTDEHTATRFRTSGGTPGTSAGMHDGVEGKGSSLGKGGGIEF